MNKKLVIMTTTVLIFIILAVLPNIIVSAQDEPQFPEATAYVQLHTNTNFDTLNDTNVSKYTYIVYGAPTATLLPTKSKSTIQVVLDLNKPGIFESVIKSAVIENGASKGYNVTKVYWQKFTLMN